MNSDLISVKDILRQLYEDRKVSGLIIAVCFCVFGAYGLVVPKQYTAGATIFSSTYNQLNWNNMLFEQDLNQDIDEMEVYWGIVKSSQKMKAFLETDLMAMMPESSLTEIQEKLDFPKQFSVVKIQSGVYYLKYSNHSAELATIVLGKIMAYESRINEDIGFSKNRNLFKVLDAVEINKAETKPKTLLNLILAISIGVWISILRSFLRAINRR